MAKEDIADTSFLMGECPNCGKQFIKNKIGDEHCETSIVPEPKKDSPEVDRQSHMPFKYRRYKLQ